VFTVLISIVAAPTSSLFLPLLIVSYGIIGIVLGLLWPNDDLVIGLCLITFWVLIVIAMVLISDPVPSSMKTELEGLALHFSVIVAAFLGIALGKIIKGHRIVGPED
jgi:hypothetical protein